MIQAQYDAALKNPPWEKKDEFDIDDRPSKKRKRWFYEVVKADGTVMDVIDEDTSTTENPAPPACPNPTTFASPKPDSLEIQHCSSPLSSLGSTPSGTPDRSDPDNVSNPAITVPLRTRDNIWNFMPRLPVRLTAFFFDLPRNLADRSRSHTATRQHGRNLQQIHTNLDRSRQPALRKPRSRKNLHK